MQDIDSEKKAGPSPSLPGLRNKKSTTRLTFLISAIFFASTLLLLAIAAPPSVRDKLTLWQDYESSQQDWVPSSAAGEEYLLGVGKADITGYASDELFWYGFCFS